MSDVHDWSAKPVLDWLLDEGRCLSTPTALIEGLGAQLRLVGMPVDRMTVVVFSLHPLYAGVRYSWDGGEVTASNGTHEFMQTAPFLSSPMHRIVSGESLIRRRLSDSECPDDFPFVPEYRAEGFTDYVITALLFGDGSRNCISLSTRRDSGFSDHDLAEARTLLNVFALLMDNYTNKALSATLLNTYVGQISGQRVLDGRIKRGDGDLIDAIIWFSDLRDSTPLTESLGHAAFLALLNEYFDATAGAVTAHGGEVLRFIGDASLAVFPIEGDRSSFEVAARTAVGAATSAMQAVNEINHRREKAGDVPLRCGIGMNRGEVLYGNIGTPARLEFSVIGAAANEAARIESLCKTKNQRLVVSKDIARSVDAPWIALGQQSLRGVRGQREYFGLVD